MAPSHDDSRAGLPSKPFQEVPETVDEPLNRPAAPILEEEVEVWITALSAFNEDGEAVPSPHDPTHWLVSKFVSHEPLRSLLMAAGDLLRNPKFLHSFSEHLYGSQLLAYRGFTPGRQDHGSRFLSRWHLAGVVPPLWDHSLQRYTLLAPFPVPIPERSGPNDDPVLTMILLHHASSGALPLRSPNLTTSDVVTWARAVEREIQSEVRHAPSPAKRPLSSTWYLSLEQTIERMLDPDFLQDFVFLLKERYHMFPDSPNLRWHGTSSVRKFAVRWRIHSIRDPRWARDERRFGLLAPFPLPIVQLMGTSERRKIDRGVPTLDHALEASAALRRYTVHHLLCTRCYSMQGPLGIHESLLLWPTQPRLLHDQLSALVRDRRRRGRPPESRIDQLLRGIGEELWGTDSARAPTYFEGTRDVMRAAHDEDGPRSEGATHRLLGRLPMSGLTSRVLDVALDLQWVDAPYAIDRFFEFKELGWRRLQQITAGILRRLACPHCDEKGFLRFWPRVWNSIDANEPPTQTADSARKLGTFLGEARARVSASPALQRVFWFPSGSPRIRLKDVGDRIDAMCRVAGSRDSQRIDERRAVEWIIRQVRLGDQTWEERVASEVLHWIPASEDDEVFDLLTAFRDSIRRRICTDSRQQVLGEATRMLGGAPYLRLRTHLFRLYSSHLRRRRTERSSRARRTLTLRK